MLLNKYLSSVTNFIFPHTCTVCSGELYTQDELLCWKCLENLPITKFELHNENPVSRYFYGRIKLEHAGAWLYFTKASAVQQLIHLYKYRNEKELAIYMGKQMGYALQKTNWIDTVDIIVPLPLNKKKLLKRGYNQANLLSTGIGQVLNKPVEELAVIRTKFTETQTRKTRLQRWLNVEEVFDIKNADLLNNKHILLIDDVVTTGATLEACAQKMVDVPGIKISVYCMATAMSI
jgi:ComF family protein